MFRPILSQFHELLLSLLRISIQLTLFYIQNMHIKFNTIAKFSVRGKLGRNWNKICSWESLLRNVAVLYKDWFSSHPFNCPYYRITC